MTDKNETVIALLGQPNSGKSKMTVLTAVTAVTAQAVRHIPVVLHVKAVCQKEALKTWVKCGK